MSNSIEISIPNCIDQFAEHYSPSAHDEDKMRFVIAASEASLKWGLGGPFAAAIFRLDNHQLVSAGVNLIINQGLSILHAEVVAIMRAQRLLGTYDLGDGKLPPMALVTSTEPCTMCLGATHWSGISKVISGATDADANSIGFDEGPKPDDWAKALRERGIEVKTEVLRGAAIEVLKKYETLGGNIYNSLRNTQ
jgi:tRNA(Arg) A34 adenosine deaminase TadA